MGVTFADQRHNRQQIGKAVREMQHVLRGAELGAAQALTLVAVDLTNRVKRTLSQHGTGRIYRRRGIEHQASKPGAPPAPDTGLYRNSWTWAEGVSRGRPFVEVGTGDRRGPWLEVGTHRMGARPHLRPVIESATDDIARTVQDGWERGLGI